MKLFDKVKWVMGILLVFFLIVATNLIDKNNFQRVRDSVVGIYEDRLVAKELIFEMSMLTNDKAMAVALGDAAYFSEKNQKANNELVRILKQYHTTQLTPDEAVRLEELEASFERLRSLETSSEQLIAANQAAYAAQIKQVNTHLRALSSIQMEEGKRQLSIGKRAVESIELFTQIEIYLLIFLALVVQILVLYRPKEG